MVSFKKSHLFPLILLILIDHIGHGIFFPILAPVFVEPTGILGPEASDFIRSFWYNATLSIFPIALFFGAPILGNLSDQFGRKKVLIICLLGTILGYTLSAIAIDISSISLLIFSRVLAGLTSGSMPIAQAAIIDLSTEEEKASNLGIVISAASIGFLLGPFIGGFFTDTSILSCFCYSTPFYIASFLAIINLVFLWFKFDETYKSSAHGTFSLKESLDLCLAPIKVKALRLPSFVFLLVQLGWGFYFQFISLYLMKVHSYSSRDIGFFMSMMGVGFAIGSSFGIRLFAKYIKDVSLTQLSLLLVIITIILTVLPLPSIFIWTSSIIIGTLMAIIYSLMIKFFSSLVGADKQGWIMGVSESIVSVAWSLTPLISTYLETVTISLPLSTGAFLLGLGLLLFSFWKILDQKKPTLSNDIPLTS